MRLEPARPQDSLDILRWRNDEDTRLASRNTDEISFPDHIRWMSSHQEFIQIGWVAVGSVRVEAGEINVTVAPEHRGKGYSGQLIRAASIPNTQAFIKEDNERSLRAFKSSHYVEINRSDGIVEMIWPGPH